MKPTTRFIKKTKIKRRVEPLVTIARGTISPFEVKLAKTFHNEGYTVNSVSIYEPTDDKKEKIDNCYFLLDKALKNKQASKIGIFYTLLLIVKNIRRIWKPLKTGGIVIGVSEPNSFISFVFMLSKAILVYYPYDIPFFRYKNYNENVWYDRYFEKYNFKKCDGIMHKGPKDELNYLPDSFKAKDKPMIQFLPYCDEEKMIPINEDKPDEIHIVYAGLIYLEKFHYGFHSMSNVFKGIVKQKLHVHVYPINYDFVVNDPEYIELQKSEYFILHAPIFGDAFREELSKYHWGLYILYFDMSIMQRLWADTVFGNKVSDYLEAGIPTITNRELSFVSEILKEYDIGITVKHYNDVREELEKVNYEQMRNKVKANRNKFTMLENRRKLIDFLEGIK